MRGQPALVRWCPSLTSSACFDPTLSILSENMQPRFSMQRLGVIRCAGSLSVPNGAGPPRRDDDIARELVDADIQEYHKFFE